MLEVLESPPPDISEIPRVDVVVTPAQWRARRPNGARTTDLVLPVGEWVELRIQAELEPERVDARELGWSLTIPQHQTLTRWVRARRPFHVESVCVGACGELGAPRITGDFTMVIEARASADYRAYESALLSPPAGSTLAAWGSAIALDQGCLACHNGFVAGNLTEFWGESRVMPDGRGIVVRGDDARAYLDAWLREPASFERSSPMPAYDLPDAYRDALLAYAQCGADDCPAEPASLAR